jgi:hypothetical protein
MAEKIDIVVDNTTNDLAIHNGDFIIDEQSKTQAKFIMLASKGEIRQYPLLGVGINKYIGSNLADDILFNVVSNELQSDDLVLDTLNVSRVSNTVSVDIELK